MIAAMARLRALPPAERKLVLEAVFGLAVAAFAIAFVPFRRIGAHAGRGLTAAPIDEGDKARLVAQVRRVVSGCARRVPWRAQCFEQGLAAQWMLRRRRVAATLYYGVAKGEDRELAAHVWVRAGALDVIGCENSADFSELARFPAR
jgi:transglutaminase superfamily protein